MANNYWLKSGFLNILQSLTGVLFGFGGFYMLVRILDKNHFGAWTLFMTTISILEVMRNGLTGNALVKFLSGASPEEHPKIITASATISASLTGLCVILNFVFAHQLSILWKTPELELMFYVHNITFILSGILALFNSVEQAHLQFSGVFMTSFIRQAILFGYIVVCYTLNYATPLMYLVYAQIAGIAVSTIMGYIYARKHLVYERKLFPEWIKKLFNFGKYTFGTSVSSILSGTIDQMMLGAMLSPVASGAFNVAVRITNLIEIPTGAIANIVFPQSAKRIETHGLDGVRYLYEKSVGTILALVIPAIIFLYAFSGFIVNIIAGGKYEDSIPLLKITLLYCIFVPFGRQFGIIIDSIGKTRLTFSVVLLTASINIGMNYFLIGSQGVMGAAHATLYSNIIGFIIGQFILYKELKVNVFHPFIYAFRFYPEFYQQHVKPRIFKNR
ncbi:flippase [Flectobacillus major]|jgi:O-antigen/teichoic acid export membrane protein|uniref:flippase n=1 Tax=Flectobacillus major TaxID=103 RepID=UPI000410B5BC|nr:flippase [Flectobacillus major]